MDKESELEKLAVEINCDNLARILELTNDLDEMIRAEAFELTINYGSSAMCRIQVRKGLHDVDELVRATCAEIVGYWKDQESLKALFTMALEDESQIVSMYAIIAIGDLGDKKVIPKLKYLITKVGKRKRLFFHYALYKLDGSLIYLKRFLNGLQNKDYHLHCVVANLCVEIVNDSNKDYLIKTIQKVLKNEKTIAASSSMQTFLTEVQSV